MSHGLNKIDPRYVDGSRGRNSQVLRITGDNLDTDFGDLLRVGAPTGTTGNNGTYYFDHSQEFHTFILNHNDSIGFVYCDYVVVREGNQRTLEINTLDKLLDHGAGVMFRKKYLESIGLYDEKYKNCEDFDLLLRYMKNFDGYHLRLPYYRYYKENGLSSKLEERMRIKKEILEKQNVY